MKRQSWKHAIASCGAVSLLALGPVLVSGCVDCTPAVDAAQQTINILDDAIRRLSNTSADWQVVMQETIDQLSDDAQSTIRNELTELVQRGTAALAVSAMCTVDFVHDRLEQDLRRIVARLRGQTLPPLEPHFCSTSVSAIDMGLPPDRPRQLDFFGYDFDRAEITVLLENAGGTIDVSHALDRPTHYQMTLNLGANGVPLSPSSKRLILKWGGREVSSVAIIQPVTPICRERTRKHTPSPISFLPPHTNGDREFSGNGPEVLASVQLERRNDQIAAHVYMRAKETKADWTTAEGDRTFAIIPAAAGWRISEIELATLVSRADYVDSDHAMDTLWPGEGPVQRFEIVGDTSGNDAGIDTSMKVLFNEISFIEVEASDCVSSIAFMSAVAVNAVSLGTMTRIRPQLTREMVNRAAPAVRHRLAPP